MHFLMKLPDSAKWPILYKYFTRKYHQDRADDQNLWDKEGIVINRNNWPRSYNVLNESGNVMIRNGRHFISTNEKITEKFSYDSIIPSTTKLPESVAPRQTVNSPKPATSSTTINPSKPIVPNGTKITQSGRVSKSTKQVYWTVLNYVH